MANAVQGAHGAPNSTEAPVGGFLSRPFRLALARRAAGASSIAVDCASRDRRRTRDTTSHRTEAQRIVAIARSHIGARFRLGTEGPRTFDCSGLIYRVYKQAGLLNRIGGRRRQAAGYYYWFKHHNAGQPQQSAGRRPGDLEGEGQASPTPASTSATAM